MDNAYNLKVRFKMTYIWWDIAAFIKEEIKITTEQVHL